MIVTVAIIMALLLTASLSTAVFLSGTVAWLFFGPTATIVVLTAISGTLATGAFWFSFLRIKQLFG